MNQLNKKQAKDLADSEFYKELTPLQIAEFQLFQERLCMPMDVFIESLSKALNRSVFTHELAYPDKLKKELLGEREHPTFEDIINLVPERIKVIIF